MPVPDPDEPPGRPRSRPARGRHDHLGTAVHPGRRRAAARPGSSRAGWRTRWRAGSSGRATCWSSRSPTRRRARCAGDWRRWASRGVAASTFHAAALRQLRHFWPRVHGTDPPAILESKVPILAPLARGLPGGYRYLAVRDLAAEIEWAKARRIGPAEYELRAIDADRDASLPPDLMAGLFRRYEAAKDRAGRIDFEDMLELTIGLIEADAAIAAEVRDRYRWFSVDEYQDTNPLQAALLEAWLGGRDDLAVVGDEDQTIYTFTGATSDYLIGFADALSGGAGRDPRDELPLDAGGPGARQPRPGRGANAPSTSDRRARRPGRPSVSSRACRRARRRRSAGSRPARPSWPASRARSGRSAGRAPPTARWPSSSGPTRSCRRSRTRSGAAGIPFHVRGERFFARPEVRRAIRVATAARTRRRQRDRSCTAAGDRVRARAGCPARHDPGRGGGERAPRRGRHPARAGRGARPDGPHGRRRGVPRRGRAPDRDRGRRRGGRRRAADLSPGQGPRMGRGLPARARGGHAADPPGDRARRARPRSDGCCTSGSPALGATSGCRGRPARTGATGREGRRSRSRFLDGLVPAGGATGSTGRRADGRVRSARRRRARRRSTRPTDRRSRMRCVPGARPVPGPTPSRRSSSSTTRRSRPSRLAGRARWPSSGACPGVGPMKLDRYGEEIIGVVVRDGTRGSLDTADRPQARTSCRMNATYASPKHSTVSATSATICGQTSSRLWSIDSTTPWICCAPCWASPTEAGALIRTVRGSRMTVEMSL